MPLEEKKKKSDYIFTSQHRADQMTLKQKMQEEGLFEKKLCMCPADISPHLKLSVKACPLASTVLVGVNMTSYRLHKTHASYAHRVVKKDCTILLSETQTSVLCRAASVAEGVGRYPYIFITTI